MLRNFPVLKRIVYMLYQICQRTFVVCINNLNIVIILQNFNFYINKKEDFTKLNVL